MLIVKELIGECGTTVLNLFLAQYRGRAEMKAIVAERLEALDAARTA